MDLSSYASALGIYLETHIPDSKIKSEKRYMSVIQYIYAKNAKKFVKFIGTSYHAISDPKKSFESAKNDLLKKCKKIHEDSCISILVVEQHWATVKSSGNLLSTEDYLFQPISSRWLTWDEIRDKCF